MLALAPTTNADRNTRAANDAGIFGGPGTRTKFYYDNLNRLDYSTLNSVTNLDLTYNALGNITMKSDVCPSPPTPCYSYHATKKHAVTAAGSLTFGYDANGNVNSRNGSPITWYSYNLPNTINASGSNSSQFFYTPDRARWKQVASYAGTSETTIYIGGLIEKVMQGTVTSWKHYISGGSGPVALYTRKSDATNQWRYLTKDHLGSVDSVTNGSGGVVVRLSFEAFGERRKEAGWSGNPPAGDWTDVTNTTRRGFTFHEHLDNLTLIHMNGRVYDPAVGRFLSADPYIQAPGLTQSFNRYSYTFNSPLSYVDPSGYFLDTVRCYDCYKTLLNPRSVWSWLALWWPMLEVQREFPRQRDPTWSVPPGTTTPPTPEPDPDPAPTPEPPAPEPIDEQVNVSVTSVPCDVMPCGSTVGGAGSIDAAVVGAATLSVAARRAALRDPRVLAGLGAIAGSLYWVAHSRTAGFLQQPDYMSGKEYVPPSGALDVGGATTPGDPNQHDPNRPDKGSPNVQFGASASQTHHAFRHVDQLGLDRAAVQGAIRQDLLGRSLPVRELYSGSVEVGGIRLQYNAYRLSEEIINVGRITGP